MVAEERPGPGEGVGLGVGSWLSVVMGAGVVEEGSGKVVVVVVAGVVAVAGRVTTGGSKTLDTGESEGAPRPEEVAEEEEGTMEGESFEDDDGDCCSFRDDDGDGCGESWRKTDTRGDDVVADADDETVVVGGGGGGGDSGGGSGGRDSSDCVSVGTGCGYPGFCRIDVSLSLSLVVGNGD